ncbi:hypothetical protein AB6D11_19175 [Vibrio splendidus]
MTLHEQYQLALAELSKFSDTCQDRMFKQEIIRLMMRDAENPELLSGVKIYRVLQSMDKAKQYRPSLSFLQAQQRLELHLAQFSKDLS